MSSRSEPERFLHVEKVFFRIVLASTVLTALLAFGAYAAANLAVAVPAAIVSFTGLLIYYHGGATVFALLRILRYLFRILPRFHGAFPTRSLIALFVSPVLGYVAYVSFFIMALTGCAA